MAQRTVYTCDRCGKDNLGGVRNVDLGNDYVKGRDAVTGQKQRIALDLCAPCWNDLKTWVETKPPREMASDCSAALPKTGPCEDHSTESQS